MDRAADTDPTDHAAPVAESVGEKALGGDGGGDATTAITLLLENPSKAKNWGPLLRCCAAFGIRTIFVVGYDICDVRGSHGSSKHVSLAAVPTHAQAASLLKSEGFELVGLLSPPPDGNAITDGDREVVRERFVSEARRDGVEIVRIAGTADAAAGATDISVTGEGEGRQHRYRRTSFPVYTARTRFPRRICLVVDKLKRGLPWSLAEHCASFVHVPHANCNPGGSMLTLEATASIVFHEATNAGWAGYHRSDGGLTENGGATEFGGQKYRVEAVCRGGADAEARDRKRKERDDRAREMRDEATAAAASSRLFGDGGADDGDY